MKRRKPSPSVLAPLAISKSSFPINPGERVYGRREMGLLRDAALRRERENNGKWIGWTQCQAWCGWAHPDSQMEMHHVVPRSVAGALGNVLSNVLMLCRECHRRTEMGGPKKLRCERTRNADGLWEPVVVKMDSDETGSP